MSICESDALPWLPHEMPSLLINRLARLLSQQADEQLGEVGLTASQLPVLVSLKDGGSLTQKALAERAGVAQPSMAQLLARMERDGLVQRTPSNTDGRTSLISLTVQAKRRLEPGRDALRQVDDAACAIFSDSERQTLTTLLQRMVQHAESNEK